MSTQHSENTCSQCTSDLGPPSAQYNKWTMACGHVLCACCLTSMLECPFISVCPLCSMFVKSLVHTYFKLGRPSIRPSLKKRDAYINLAPPKDVSYLSFTSEKECHSINLQTSSLSPKDESILVCVFEMLHSILVPRKKSIYNKSDESDFDKGKGTYWDRIKVLVDTDTASLLTRLVTKLAWGKDSIPDQKEDSARAQMYVATECIRGAKEERGSLFRTLMTSAMHILGKCDRVNLLKRLRLSYNTSTERKNEKRRASSLRSRLKKLVLDKYCYPILCYDNLGFKNRQGWRKGLGYEQFTVLYLILISRKQLQELNIYGENALSRERKKWIDVRKTEEGSYAAILMPTKDDCNLFAGTIIDIYHAVMVGESEAIFPSLDKSRELLRTEAFRNGKIPNIWKCPQYRGRLVLDAPDEDEGEEAVCEDVHYDNPMRQDLNKKATVINLIKYLCCIINDMLQNDTLGDNEDDVPIVEDVPVTLCGDGSPTSTAQNWLRDDGRSFAKTVCASFGGFHLMLEVFKKRGTLFEHTHLRNLFAMTRMSSKQQDYVLNPSDPNQADAETIGMHAGIILSSLRNLHDIKREGKDYHAIFKEDMKYDCEEDANSVEGEDEEEDDFQYQDDDDEENGVNSNDEFDIEQEDDIDLTMIEREEDEDNGGRRENENASAEVNHAEGILLLDQANNIPNTRDIWISPAQLIDFIIARAECNPQAFIVLLDMRFAEIIFMLHRAESRAETALFCAACRYSVLLCVNTNATHYVEMMCNFNIDRACMSPAERAIHDNFILFRKTKNGKTIFTDRSVEWVMKDIRETLGKFFTDYTPSKLENFMLQLKDLKNFRGRDKRTASSSSSSKKSDVKIDATFLEAYVFCESANMWRGRPQAVMPKPYKKRLNKDGVEETKDIGPPTYFYSTTGKILYADVLSTLSRGISRSKNHFDIYHVRGDVNSAYRSQTESNMKTVHITDDNLQKEIIYGLTFSIDKLAAVAKNPYNILRMQQELALQNDVLGENGKELITPEKVKSRVSKKSWATALVEARKETKKLAVDNGEDWEGKERQRIIERYEGTRSKPLEIIEKELSDSFFNLAGTGAKQSELATTTICFKYGLQGSHANTFEREASFLGNERFYQIGEDMGWTYN